MANLLLYKDITIKVNNYIVVGWQTDSELMKSIIDIKHNKDLNKLTEDQILIDQKMESMGLL